MTPRITDAMLRQIASDAKVDHAQFIRFVTDFGLSIMTAVNACRDMDRAKREAKAKRGGWRVKGKQRRQKAANAYHDEAWRLDVR